MALKSTSYRLTDEDKATIRELSRIWSQVESEPISEIGTIREALRRCLSYERVKADSEKMNRIAKSTKTK